ncbi:hypothetical protein FF38_01728 [Lucilia cuprina]|uniref:Uncharacterized protein n=1 Tax=Lucilia cuprina TaxID=7375 RepID=A0A0L0CKP8_LUCCU|nr:hypothetical protein FF38_01728 [Lucilia cuprina]
MNVSIYILDKGKINKYENQKFKEVIVFNDDGSFMYGSYVCHNGNFTEHSPRIIEAAELVVLVVEDADVVAVTLLLHAVAIVVDVADDDDVVVAVVVVVVVGVAVVDPMSCNDDCCRQQMSHYCHSCGGGGDGDVGVATLSIVDGSLNQYWLVQRKRYTRATILLWLVNGRYKLPSTISGCKKIALLNVRHVQIQTIGE